MYQPRAKPEGPSRYQKRKAMQLTGANTSLSQAQKIIIRKEDLDASKDLVITIAEHLREKPVLEAVPHNKSHSLKPDDWGEGYRWDLDTYERSIGESMGHTIYPKPHDQTIYLPKAERHRLREIRDAKRADWQRNLYEEHEENLEKALRYPVGHSSPQRPARKKKEAAKLAMENLDRLDLVEKSKMNQDMQNFQDSRRKLLFDLCKISSALVSTPLSPVREDEDD